MAATQTREPLSSGERADHVAAELQAAFGAPAGSSDVQRVCSLLALLRQQFSEQAPKNWPADTVKRLWQSITGALRVAQAPEVQIASCAAVEALGQSCSSCTDLDREPASVDDAVSVVVDTVTSAAAAGGNRQVLAAAVKALLSLSGCLNCRCFYDKATQEVLGKRGAVRALLAALRVFLVPAPAADAAAAAAGGDGAEDGGAAAAATAAQQQQQAVADIFRALHYACLLHTGNTATLVEEGGYRLIMDGLAGSGKDLNVQEHGAMLLAEMACSGGGSSGSSGVASGEVLDAVATVANIARLQLQDKYIEVARAAVWSLGRLAAHTLAVAPAGSGSGNGSGGNAGSAGGSQLAEAWPLLSDPVLRVVVSMLQSCHLQDDPLVKHCLDYIAVVASAAPLHRGAAASPPAAAAAAAAANGNAPPAVAAAAADEDGSPSGGALQALMRLAAEAVLATARVACDIRLQAVVLRTLHVLLNRFPGAVALGLGPRQAEVIDQIFRIGTAARQTLEQQQATAAAAAAAAASNAAAGAGGQGAPAAGAAAPASGSHAAHAASQQQQQQQLFASKDLFLVHLFSLTSAAAATDPAAFGPANVTAAAAAAANGSSLGAYQTHVLTCLSGVVRHLTEGGGGDAISYDAAAAAAAAAAEAPAADEPAAQAPAPAVAAAAADSAATLTVGCCRYACHCCFIHDTVRGVEVLAAVRAAAALLKWCAGADGVNAADARDGTTALHVLAAGGAVPLLAAYIEAAGSDLDFLRRTRAGANALQLARGRKHTAAAQMLEDATEAAAKAAQDALLKELEAEGAEASSGPSGGKRTGSTAGSSAAAAKHQQHQQHHQHQQHKHAPVAGGAAAQPQAGGAAPEGDSEEARKAREELERKRRAAEEEYEAALEQRRRQLEEEARQQAAEEARLIELAQQESLRMATPPPQPPVAADAPAAPAAPASGAAEAADKAAAAAAAAEASAAAADAQLSAIAAAAAAVSAQAADAAAPGSLEASLQAAAAAMASGAPLPPHVAQILAQLAADQQMVAAAAAAASQVPPPAHHLPTLNGRSGGGAPPPPPAQPSLSAMDEQVTMMHGGAGGMLGMRRVVSKGAFMSPPEDAAAAAAGPAHGHGHGLLGHGAGGLGGVAGYAGSFGNLLAAGGAGPGDAGGLMGPGAGAGAGYDAGNVRSGSLGGASMDSTSSSLPQGWPGNAGAAGGGPAAFLTGALGNQAAPGMPRAGPAGDMWISGGSGSGSGAAPGRGSHADLSGMMQHPAPAAPQPPQPPPPAQLAAPGGLHESLASGGGEMWSLADEATRGPSRQLWLGNVAPGLPSAHLQALCQQFGPVQDAAVAPGTLSAAVLFARADDASRAAHALHARDVPGLSYEGKSLVVRYCSTAAADAAAAAAAAAPPPGAGAAGAPGGADAGSAGGEGVLGLGLPPSLEAALAAAGFGPGALEAAMQGLLPPDQQAALHAVLLQVSQAPAPPAQPPAAPAQPRGVAPPGGAGGRPPLGGGVHGSMGSMDHLAGMVGAGSVGDLAALQAAAGLGGPGFPGDGAGGAGSLFSGDDGDGAGAGGPAGGSQGGGSTTGDLEGDTVDVPEGKPSRHLWLGNIPLKPNKLAMELLFARFGPLESVRVFPGKTFAFVNYLAPQHAVAAKMALDGQPAPSVTGSKPMVIRYQKDTSTVPANLGMAGGKSMSRSSSTQNLTGLTAAASLARLLDEDLPPEPAVNLSNKLNPNNIHYDRELAARYKRMSKAEKEALWAQDRAMQALGANAAAMTAAVNAGAAGIAGLLDPTNAAAARLLAQAGLGNLAAGLGGAAANDFLIPRVMSAGALDYLAASHGAAAGHSAGGHPTAHHGGGGGLGGHAGGAGAGGGHHGGLFRVNTTQSLLGMQQAANAAMMLPGMGGGAGGLQGLLAQQGPGSGAGGLDGAAAALQQQIQAQQQALQQQLQQQALQQQLQQLAAGGGGGNALLNNLAVSQALANLGLTGAGGAGSTAAAAAAAAAAAVAQSTGRGGAGGAGGAGGLDWASMQAALANLGLGGAGGAAGSSPAGAAQAPAALAALLQHQQQAQQHHQQAQQQRLQQHQQAQQQQQQLSAAAAALAGADGGGFGGPQKRLPHVSSQSRLGQTPGLPPGGLGAGGLGNPLMDATTAAALMGGLQGLGGAGAPGAPGALPPPGMGMAPPSAAGLPRPPPPMGTTFKQIPPSFLCPLTRQLMSDPVVAADGITYNRPAIADWLRQHDASPVTRQPLANKMLTPNVALRNAIMSELGFTSSG